jgi:hypothetical protein
MTAKPNKMNGSNLAKKLADVLKDIVVLPG